MPRDRVMSRPANPARVVRGAARPAVAEFEPGSDRPDREDFVRSETTRSSFGLLM